MILTVFLRLLVPALLFASAAHAEKRSVFERVEAEDTRIRVRFENRDFQLSAIDGYTTDQVIAFCKKTYGDDWKAAFSLQLVAVLTALRGTKPPDHISVVLQREDTGEKIVIEKAAMTGANWRKVFWSRQGFGRPIAVSRPDRKISREQAAIDMKQLNAALSARFAYLGQHKDGSTTHPFPNGFTLTVAEFKVLLARSLADFDDPNTGVPGLLSALPGRFLPFTVRPVGKKRVVAIDKDGERLLNPMAPYLAALDSRRPPDWVRGLSPFIPEGTRSWQRYAGAELVAKFDAVRQAAGTKVGQGVWVTLESEDREVRVRVQMVLSDTALRQPQSTDVAIRMLDGDIACVPLPHMEGSDAFRRQVEPLLKKIQNSKGLILDLRGNASSNRELIRVLLPRLLSRAGGPRVVNVAVARRGSTDENAGDELGDWGLFPTTWSRWSEAEKQAVAACAKTFEPEWKYPAERYSPLRYMVVGPGEEVYERPIAILVDGATRNDAEVLTAALQGQKNVTVVGEPTGGSDGRPEYLLLRNSRVRVSISTMVSFRPDGKLFNGRSIQPDTVVMRTPTDCIGRTDTQLAAAVQALLRDK